MFEDNKWIVVILLICVLSVNLFILKMVYTRYEAFAEEPLTYGAVLHGVNSCSCITDRGSTFMFNKSSLWKPEKVSSKSSNVSNINWSGLIITNEGS